MFLRRSPRGGLHNVLMVEKLFSMSLPKEGHTIPTYTFNPIRELRGVEGTLHQGRDSEDVVHKRVLEEFNGGVLTRMSNPGLGAQCRLTFCGWKRREVDSDLNTEGRGEVMQVMENVAPVPCAGSFTWVG